MSSRSSRFIAFNRSGRFNVIVATRSATSNNTVFSAMRPSDFLFHALQVGVEIGVFSLEIELRNVLARDEMGRNGDVPEVTSAGIESAARDRLAGLSKRSEEHTSELQ